MKISVDEEHNIIFSDVFLGIGIQTDRGIYGISQRDDAIEIVLPNGGFIDSDTIKRMEEKGE